MAYELAEKNYFNIFIKTISAPLIEHTFTLIEHVHILDGNYIMPTNIQMHILALMPVP